MGVSIGQNKADVKFTVAKNYFVKNTFKNEEVVQKKIVSQKDFDEIFGMASLMGAEGKPTPIDFKKQFVIVVICKETNKATELQVLSLQKGKKNKLLLQFETKIGTEMTYVSQAFLIIVVDDKYKNQEIEFINAPAK
jgi:hypothetical protein